MGNLSTARKALDGAAETRTPTAAAEYYLEALACAAVAQAEALTVIAECLETMIDQQTEAVYDGIEARAVELLTSTNGHDAPDDDNPPY